MSEAQNFTSLAVQLSKEGYEKTPLARAVAELVASWLGTTMENKSMLNALQAVKGNTALTLSSGETSLVSSPDTITANSDSVSGKETIASVGKPTINDKTFKLAA